MQRLSTSVYVRCRTSIFRSSNPDQWLNSTGLVPIFRRHRGGGYTRKRVPQKWTPPDKKEETIYRPKIDPDNIPAWVEDDVVRWTKFRDLPARLQSFGIPSGDVDPLLRKFAQEVRRGRLSSPEAVDKYGLIRFVQKLSKDRYLSEMDVIYTTMFFTWASDPLRRSTLEMIVSPDTVSSIQRLAQAADRKYPGEEYSAARKLNRKVIMHVGPTNSGKTYHALRALAAAPSGVYAGPLRLLAHEIWERLNLGQIVPLGVEDEGHTATYPATPVPDVDSALDLQETPPEVRKLGNPKYARVCNMITGEEHRIVSPDASLLSCTVEMVSFHRMHDVAVIDEIQMIADEQRGSGWSNAVLGVCAKELHLCGEETAVPLIEALLKDTGDELIVTRYKRLTPLVVEKESLDGDFSRVQKGDCIVTFRRSSIFSIKRQVEEQTGMRCVVVYGRLPPEIRSQQAALFNDPNSGFDVMVASDSIGMGLNLKIKRVVFEAVKKWDGGMERALSTSQVKQIAGRAGRYGLHGDQAPGGSVTTLNAADLPFIRRTIDLPNEPLQFARLGHNAESFVGVANALPPGSSTATIYKAHIYISRLQPMYRFSIPGDAEFSTMCEFIDTRGRGLTMRDRQLLLMAPVPWRDKACVEIIGNIIRMYTNQMSVNLMECLGKTNYLKTLTAIEEKIAAGHPPHGKGSTLEKLETFHKVLVFYMWMSYRNPVSFHRHEETLDIKTRVEKALDWTLEGMSKNVPAEQIRMTWENTRAKTDLGEIAYASKQEAKALWAAIPR